MKLVSELAWRFLLYGAVSLIVAFLIYFSQKNLISSWIFTTAIAAIAAIALYEYYQMGMKKNLQPAIWLGIAFAAFFVYAILFKIQCAYPPATILQSFIYHLPELTLGGAFFGCFIYYAARSYSPILNIPITYLGIVYIGVPMGLMVRITYFFEFGNQIDYLCKGTWWLVYLIVVTKSADTGGYFFGKYLGKVKLAKKLSPKKTFEGALGGLLSSIVMSIGLCFLGRYFGRVFLDFSIYQAIALGFFLGIFGQLGDLAESMFKRDANIKDSNSIPGIGGMLDMIDSLLFTTPVVYLFLRIYYT